VTPLKETEIAIPSHVSAIVMAERILCRSSGYPDEFRARRADITCHAQVVSAWWTAICAARTALPVPGTPKIRVGARQARWWIRLLAPQPLK